MGCNSSTTKIRPSLNTNNVSNNDLSKMPRTSSSRELGPIISTDSTSNNIFIDDEPVVNRSLRDWKEFISFRNFLNQSEEPQIFEYKFLKPLGRGAQAEVYLVINTETNVFLAAKVYDKAFLYRNNLGDSEPPIQKAIREITIMSLLKHPYTIPLVEVLDDDYTNSIIIIQKYAEKGALLPQKIYTEPLEEGYVKGVFFMVCVAVKYLHSKNIIHRDIKPENILCFSDGSVSLGDYSSSCLLDDPNQLFEDTDGTPAFYSPEQCTGKPYHGKPTDIWASGVTLYMLLFGRLPFFKPGEDKHFLSQFFKIANLIQTEEVVFPKEINVSDDVKDLILKCLEKDPNKRYTIEQVLEHKWLQGLQEPEFEESEESDYCM